MVLTITVSQFSKSVLSLVHGGAARLYFFNGIFSSIQEAYEWRRPRHETDPNL